MTLYRELHKFETPGICRHCGEDTLLADNEAHRFCLKCQSKVDVFTQELGYKPDYNQIYESGDTVLIKMKRQ